MELITFGRFGTPSGLLFLTALWFFGGWGRSVDDIGPVHIVPARDDFQSTGEPNSRIWPLHFLHTADLSGLAAPHG
jgi:hypothetical protein